MVVAYKNTYKQKMFHSLSQLLFSILLVVFLLVVPIAMASLSDHSRYTDDTPDLIASLLFCIYSEATHAHVNADLLSQNSTIPALKSMLSQCSRFLLDAENLATDAVMSMQGNKYSKAWSDCRAVKQLLFLCAHVFRGDANLSIPYSVLQHMVTAKRLADAAHALFMLILH